MKKTITITKEEKVKVVLNEREQKIYEIGEDKGFANGVLFVFATGIVVVIVLVLLKAI